MPRSASANSRKRAGVAIDTVRYYERNAMLTPAGRLESAIVVTARRNSSDCGSSGAPRCWASRLRTYENCCP